MHKAVHICGSDVETVPNQWNCIVILNKSFRALSICNELITTLNKIIQKENDSDFSLVYNCKCILSNKK